MVCHKWHDDLFTNLLNGRDCLHTISFHFLIKVQVQVQVLGQRYLWVPGTLGTGERPRLFDFKRRGLYIDLVNFAAVHMLYSALCICLVKTRKGCS